MVEVRGPMTLLSPPEADSHIALVDVRADTADAAIAAAWTAYGGPPKWPVLVRSPQPDDDGWTAIESLQYQTSPNEARGVGVGVQRANDVWTVTIYDMANAVGEKRLAQVASIRPTGWGWSSTRSTGCRSYTTAGT
jgi:hypothetical protein